jgi:hypothetical protein
MPRFEIDFLTEYTDEALLDELRRISVVLGEHPLTQVAFTKASGKVHAQTLIRRFGTWKETLAKAGLEHRFLTRIHAEQASLENIAEVWTHYGRPPEYREMFQPPSRIQGKTYIYRWGTWRKALKAFVDWANADEQLQGSETEPEAPQQSPAKPNRTEADYREVRPGLRFRVFKRDNFRCVACGRSPATHLNIELHADHILAVANGGKTIVENLQTLCQGCNLGKGRTLLS